jgi:SAM-dependent methyltransferase
MANPYSGPLQLWDGWAASSHNGDPDSWTAPRPRPAAGSTAHAEWLFAREAFQHRRRHRPGAEPFSLQWFLDAESARYYRQGRWIPRLLEFRKHAGERLLGVGSGLGTDWVQHARNGAEVLVCHPDAAELSLARANFELRGLQARFLHASPADLPLDPASLDVVILNDLPPGPGLDAVVAEVYRVLKPGGKVLAVVRAHYDVDFWWRNWLPWGRWLRPTSLVGAADPHHFSARGLRRLFHRFTESRVSKRHLRRAEVPHLLRWLPLPILERLLGRILVFKAFKPLSAAINVAAAA